MLLWRQYSKAQPIGAQYLEGPGPMRVLHSEYDQRGTIFSSRPGSNGAFQKTIFIHLPALNVYCIFQPKYVPAERRGQLSGSRYYELRFIGDHLGGNLNLTNCLKYKSCVSHSAVVTGEVNNC